jgi:hypothetical protein
MPGTMQNLPSLHPQMKLQFSSLPDFSEIYKNEATKNKGLIDQPLLYIYL